MTAAEFHTKEQKQTREQKKNDGSFTQNKWRLLLDKLSNQAACDINELVTIY